MINPLGTPPTPYQDEDMYDSDDYWISVTTFGSEYEIEFNSMTDKYRHRDYIFSRIELPWIPGLPEGHIMKK